MAEYQTFTVQELTGGQWQDLKQYSGYDSDAFIKATLHRDRLVTNLADQSRYRVVNQNGQIWRPTKMTIGG